MAEKLQDMAINMADSKKVVLWKLAASCSWQLLPVQRFGWLPLISTATDFHFLRIKHLFWRAGAFLSLSTEEWHRIKVLFNSTSTWCKPLFPYTCIILLTFTSVVALWTDRSFCLLFVCGHFCIPINRKQCKGLITPRECPNKIRHISSVSEGWSECFLSICSPVTLLSCWKTT